MTEHPGDDLIATAETELAEAQTALATLEGDHVDGKNVTPAQFDKAEQRVSMARRGIERAKRIMQRRRETEHETVIAGLERDVAAHNTVARLDPVRGAYAEAVEAVRAFLTVHRAYQREADQLESRARRADHRVKVSRVDYGAHGKPWADQLMRDAQRGYDIGSTTPAAYAGHKLMPEPQRLEALRRYLEYQQRSGYDDARQQRLDRITARLTEIDQEN